jgi:hypothetical protein
MSDAKFRCEAQSANPPLHASACRYALRCLVPELCYVDSLDVNHAIQGPAQMNKRLPPSIRESIAQQERQLPSVNRHRIRAAVRVRQTLVEQIGFE